MRGDLEKIVGAEHVELRVTALRASPGVAPDGDTRADAKRSDLRPEGDDLADGLVAGLTGEIRVIERGAGKHRLAAEDMEIPMRTRGDGADADEDFAGTGDGDGRLAPFRAPGRDNLQKTHVSGERHRASAPERAKNEATPP